MSDNEDTLPAAEQDSSDDVQIIDLDDVEGHGMREVAAGLGAAAMIAGGVGAATAMSVGVHPSTSGGGASVSASIDPIGTVDRATDWTIATSREVRDGALDTTMATASSADRTAGRVSDGALETAGAFVDAAGTVTQAELKAASHLATNVKDGTLATTRAVTHAATSTVKGTEVTASNVTTSTVTQATRKVATALTFTTSTVNATMTTISVTIANLNPQAGAGASMSDPGGWVSLQLGGSTIAQAQVYDGTATITVKTLDLTGKSLNLAYSGDTLHASTARAFAL
jgi:hypothetical protein